MRLVYDGPADAVEVVAAGVVAERGKSVEIDDKLVVVVNATEQGEPVRMSLVDSLLEQSTWSKARKGSVEEAEA